MTCVGSGRERWYPEEEEGAVRGVDGGLQGKRGKNREHSRRRLARKTKKTRGRARACFGQKVSVKRGSRDILLVLVKEKESVIRGHHWQHVRKRQKRRRTSAPEKEYLSKTTSKVVGRVSKEEKGSASSAEERGRLAPRNEGVPIFSKPPEGGEANTRQLGGGEGDCRHRRRKSSPIFSP